VQNIFAKTVTENVSGTDTNRVFVIRNYGDAVQIGVILNHAAFVNSLHVWLQNWPQNVVSQMSLTPPDNVYRNYFTLTFKPGVDLAKASFTIEYVKDDRETNLYHFPRVMTNHIYFNNGETFDL